MKKLLTCLFVVFFAATSYGEPIKVADTEVTFIPPQGFKKVPQKIVDIKWPSNRAPRFVIGNERASTTIAYDLKPNNIPQNKLVEAQKAFINLFERIIPGIQWKKKEIVEISGQRWIFLEMTSKAIDTDIHNIMLVTGYQGKMLLFNFNSTREEFPKYEKQLRESIKTIKLP